MDEALAKLKEALNSSELNSYLMGENGYKFHDRLVETPTDITRIFINGFNEYVAQREENIKTLKSAFNDAVIAMLKSPVGTWWTVFILYNYLFAFNKNTLSFEIDIQSIIPNLNKSLMIFKEELKKNKEWVGWRFQNGLWDNIVTMAEKINTVLDDDNSKIFTGE